MDQETAQASKILYKRRRIFANKLHRETFFSIFLISILPLVITSYLLYGLIFHITAEELGIAEAITYSIIPAARRVALILLVATPIVVGLLMIAARQITHRLVGPFDRILRELDQCLAGERKGPIIIRKNDKLLPLVDRINKLLARLGQ